MKRGSDKKAQGFSAETLIILLIALVVAGLLIWGFSNNWGGAGKTVEPWTGGNGLSFISTSCQQTCIGDSAVYCTSDLKIVNSLTVEQMNTIKTAMGAGSCFDKKGEALNDGKACVSSKIGYFRGQAGEISYYNSQAKVPCGTLQKAGLIDPCASGVTC
jgi:hypothetical protein